MACESDRWRAARRSVVLHAIERRVGSDGRRVLPRLYRHERFRACHALLPAVARGAANPCAVRRCRTPLGRLAVGPRCSTAVPTGSSIRWSTARSRQWADGCLQRADARDGRSCVCHGAGDGRDKRRRARIAAGVPPPLLRRVCARSRWQQTVRCLSQRGAAVAGVVCRYGGGRRCASAAQLARQRASRCSMGSADLP